MHVQEAERVIGSRISWLCDTIENDAKHGMGDAPNSEFIVGPDGKIVVRRQWSRPAELRADLAELVGPVKNPTRVQDIEVRFTPPPPGAPRGLVPKMTVPTSMAPLRIEARPGKEGEPFYVKLRAEADAGVMSGRGGKMYLGFHVDPLYKVHWNNLAEPVRFQLSLADGDAIEPTSGEGPKVKHPADVDPREFLVDVKQLRSGEPIRLRVDYFACHDEEGWCKPISQEYLIHVQRDADGGSARRSRRRPSPLAGRGARPGAPAERSERGRPGGLGGSRLMAQVVSYDAEKRTLTVRDRSRTETQLVIRKDARIRIGRSRKPGSLDQLRRGAVVMLMLDPDSKENQPREVIGLMMR